MSEENASEVQNSLLFGVLLKNALLIRRGADFITVKCPCIQSRHQSSSTALWSVSTTACCGDECVMFDEPVHRGDGITTIQICNGKTLWFKRLIDLRGQSDENFDFDKASDDEITQWLVDRNIIRF